eukprot:TRINITY_DN7435_c0_g1_i2.p1 TRINITY_DN7435_c0_g1~~TRINITY_DN7435_c0_g1_i2.p1  ORF type:complete len:479 (+),score=117.37 TRINITY_DN7435_c0_g1_i2:166-1437(+)
MYTEAEFTAHYKGTAEWEKAAKEHRIDEADGKAYTEEEFVRHYKRREEWERASPPRAAPASVVPASPAPVPVGPAPKFYGKGAGAGRDRAGALQIEEKRRSADGICYSKDEFLGYFGPTKGLEYWNKAGGKEHAKDGWCDSGDASSSAKDSDSGDEGSDEGGDKKPPPSSPSKEDELKKLTSQQRAVYEKAHSKETKYPSKKHCYLVYSSEQALLWELRAWLAGVCLRFDPNKAVFPALTDEWHCTTDLLEAVKHLKPEHATLPAFVTRTHAPAAAPSELLKACNLTGHEANIMNLATKLKVATPGLLQITLSPDVATELVEDEDGTNQTLAVRRGALLIDKKRVWLTPYPLSGSRARVEFQSNLTQTVLLHGHAKPLRAGLRATHPTLFSMGLHGHHTVYQDIVKALLGYVPRWFDEAKCAR